MSFGYIWWGGFFEVCGRLFWCHVFHRILMFVCFDRTYFVHLF